MDRMAAQNVKTNDKGAEPNTNKRVNKGFVPNNRSNHNPPKTAAMTMISVRHPTWAPNPTNRISIPGGVRFCEEGGLFGYIACEFYHIGLKFVNNFTNEDFLSQAGPF